MRTHACLGLGLALVVLSGCVLTVPGFGGNKGTNIGVTTRQPSPQHMSGPFALAPSHWSDVAKIKAEAERLAVEVRAGRMTKVQAANQLNQYRLDLVGANYIDDSNFQVYLSGAVDSQAGRITAEQSRSLVKSSLQGWERRWRSLADIEKPRNPAFTNFLNETMDLPYLK